MMPNAIETSVNLRRIDICDLMLACIVVAEESGAEKWQKLHDKLKAQLDELDATIDFKSF